MLRTARCRELPAACEKQTKPQQMQRKTRNKHCFTAMFFEIEKFLKIFRLTIDKKGYILIEPACSPMEKV